MPGTQGCALGYRIAPLRGYRKVAPPLGECLPSFLGGARLKGNAKWVIGVLGSIAGLAENSRQRQKQ